MKSQASDEGIPHGALRCIGYDRIRSRLAISSILVALCSPVQSDRVPSCVQTQLVNQQPYAEELTAYPLSSPQGAEIEAIATRGTTLFACTRSGVCRSDSRGESWAEVSTGPQGH